MLWFSTDRGRGGSGLPGLMDNACGILKQVAGHWGIGSISVDNFLISQRIDENDSILLKLISIPEIQVSLDF